MIKADLVKNIASQSGLSKSKTSKIVQLLLDEVVSGLASDSRIELRRFGIFGLKQQKPRMITLPSGKKINLPAQKVVIFNPSICVKKKLNQPKDKKRR